MTGNGKKSILAAAAFVAVTVLGGALAAEQKTPMHHHQFPEDIDAFHSVLAPVWHANRGKARNQNACRKVGQMESLAKDIRSTDALRLQTSVAALKVQCQEAKGDVEGALFDVHEEFHHLIEPKKGS